MSNPLDSGRTIADCRPALERGPEDRLRSKIKADLLMLDVWGPDRRAPAPARTCDSMTTARRGPRCASPRRPTCRRAPTASQRQDLMEIIKGSLWPRLDAQSPARHHQHCNHANQVVKSSKGITASAHLPPAPVGQEGPPTAPYAPHGGAPRRALDPPIDYGDNAAADALLPAI
jgi:hypothetical protein